MEAWIEIFLTPIHFPTGVADKTRDNRVLNFINDFEQDKISEVLPRSSPPIKSGAFLLADLGITKSLSRPYVSNDNPYSEAQFKTLKYRPEFPERFGCSEEDRSFCQNFFGWYNTEHYHCGIGFLTPEDVHYGRAEQIIKERQTVLNDAFAKHPERFKGKVPKQTALPEAAWINKPVPENSDHLRH